MPRNEQEASVCVLVCSGKGFLRNLLALQKSRCESLCVNDVASFSATSNADDMISSLGIIWLQVTENDSS